MKLVDSTELARLGKRMKIIYNHHNSNSQVQINLAKNQLIIITTPSTAKTHKIYAHNFTLS